ncbi:porin [Rickettsiaceae bacterium]|nr:porin [Rickettsiaceae bacterium]
MSSLKKIVVLGVCGLLSSSVSYAAEMKSSGIPVTSSLNITLSAYANFEAALRNQNHLTSDEKRLSSNRDFFAFSSKSALIADISNKMNDVTYGGKIALVPTAKKSGSPSYNGSHIYVESDFGKVEMGSPMSPSCSMMVDGSEVAAGSGTWDDYAKFDTKHLMGDSKIEPSFASFTEFFLDSKLTTKSSKRAYSSEPARTIVYYTPKINLSDSSKLRVGISYTPDSSNTGADSSSTHSSGVATKEVGLPDVYSFEIDSTVKDAVSGGVTVEQNITDGVDVKLALTGEYGKSAGQAKLLKEKDDKNPSILKLSDLRTFNVGGVMNFGNYSCSGSFGSLGKSLTTPEFHKTGRNTWYYSGSLAYKQGPFAASVSYFKSDQFKNTVDTISIGTNYLLAPGFQPYAEISSFTLKGRPEYYNGDSPSSKKSTRGTVALIGAKLKL